MTPAHTPVLVATGQAIERHEQVTPLDLMERAARAAITEAPGIERRLHALTAVNVLSRPGPAPAARLARRLRIEPRVVESTTVGGNTPVWAMGRAAAAVVAGEIDAALVVGGEAMRSRRQARLAGDRPTRKRGAPAPEPELPDDPVVGDDREGLGAAELSVGLASPAHMYPLFESVLAHRAGRDPAEQRDFLGGLMAPFTEVAAKHPYAWFPEAASPHELAEPTDDNRLTAEPYTKRMNAFMGVDQAAAFIVCSLQVAEQLGLAGQAVSIWSVATANDVWMVPERPDLGVSPGIEVAGRAALSGAGIGIDDVAMLDLYSCFPCAVQMGAAALGVHLDDRRGLTLTGGLPYFGGPGNNYPSHSIATAVERLRERGGAALVTGLGWYATKHSVAVLGAEPSAFGFVLGDTSAEQARIDAGALEVATGAQLGGSIHRATVDAATVIYGRDGRAERALAIATLADGRRVVAEAHPEDPHSLAGIDVVGRAAVVEGDPPTLRLT